MDNYYSVKNIYSDITKNYKYIKMFLKKLDWISPPITLYFKGENSHVSMYSGILSIIAYIIVFAATIYYALEFINRESPKAYFFTRYVEDAGTFPVNSTQMFHYIQVSDPQTNKKIPLDFTAFRIVGFDDAYSDDYMNEPGIVKTKNHWIYGNCNNNTDTRGISYLIEEGIFYEESACIRQYYDASKKKYFNTEEEGFRWPVIIKGCSNPERTYYGIIMQRCDKADDELKAQGPECKSSTEIDNIVSKISFNFQIIDHYADMLNYEMPFTKYFYEVTSAITSNNFIIQHLNFNPANMLTHNGFFFDNQVREEAYFFTQNEKQTITEGDANKEGKSINGCLIGVYFWMQNTLQYYERNYDRIQDILSDIGGISSIVLTIASIINLLIHNFIVLLDTEDLALSSEQDNDINQRDISRKPTIFRKANNIMCPPRRPYQVRKIPYGNDQPSQSSNYQRLIKDGVDIYNNMNNTNFKEEKTEQYKNSYLNRNNNNNYIFNNENEMNKEGYYHRDIYMSQQSQQSLKPFRGTANQFYNRGKYKLGFNDNRDIYSRNNKDDITTERKEEVEEKPLEKQNFHWCKYLGYLICCGKNDKKMSYYEDFRAKLISEENIIQNYMDIYKLLKVCNLERIEIFKKEN